ncbi:Helitron helicase [Phytophthora megakarya]|uniref:Helitron helicase n=1 Tax=Phytophthora megakarya TaxID=4795 RepID=A0A225WBV7_9STRA|nr:Helitron helicase [Phytophthora megakarya]
MWNCELDNRWVVPYNTYLSEKYHCHINTEICSTIAAIKYMYNTTHRVDIDEVKSYLTGRYICPPEACWRMLKYPMQWKSHAVIQLTVNYLK